MNKGQGYETDILEGLKTVGCLDTDSGIEELKYATDKSFVYQRSDGLYERIEIEGIMPTVGETAIKLCKDVFNNVKIMLKESNIVVACIIYASEGVIAIDDEFSKAYLVKLPDCKIEKEFAVIVSDYEE